MAYYKVWLPTFPSHAELQDVWELNWSVSWTTAFLAYVPVLVACCVHLRRRLRSGTLTVVEQFLCCALVVAIGLAFHDRIIKPVQPLHFTRGYVWMPLFLIGLPVILQTVSAVLNPGRRRYSFATLLFVLICAFDNLVFSAVHIQRQLAQQDGFHLDTDERALLASIHNLPDDSPVVMTSSATLNYLIPTYANARPWLGHHFNTPQFPERMATWNKCFGAKKIRVQQIPEDVELLITRVETDIEPLVRHNNWRPSTIRNAKWRGWVRTLNRNEK